MNKELIYVIGQMATEKGIDKEILFEALESALLSASKRTMGVGENVRLTVDRRTGAIRVFAEKQVVESVTDPKLEISLAEGQPVQAVHEGTVVYAEQFTGYGDLVIVDHGEGIFSLMAHLDQLERAVDAALSTAPTRDVGGTATTTQFTDTVLNVGFR